ncbi:hypothetical protein [Geoglobus ahangari]
MRKFALILGLMLIISAANAFEIRIEGYEGGNVTVRLIPIGNGTAENVTVQENVITFQNITNGSYHVIITYRDMQYLGSVTIPGNDTLVVNFTKTSDTSVLKIDNMHYILNYQNGDLVVLEVVNFENTADMYYAGDIVKEIPNASHLMIDDTGLVQAGVSFENVSQDGNSIVIKNATVPPRGIFSLAYLYFPQGDLEIIADYPTDIIRIIHPTAITVSAPDVFKLETQFADANGQVFVVLTATNVTKGQVFTITAEMSPQGADVHAGADRGKSPLDNPAVIVGVLLVVAGVALFLYSNRKGGGNEGEEDGGWELTDE